MKKLIISLLINISLAFTQDTHFIGGFTISTADGGDIEDVENIKGFRVGVENTKLSDYVTGVAYTQRGFVVDGFGKELEYIQQAIINMHLSGDGVFTKKCNILIEKALGVQKSLLTTSCTHALEMAAILLDICPGDEVIVPSFT